MAVTTVQMGRMQWPLPTPPRAIVFCQWLCATTRYHGIAWDLLPALLLLQLQVATQQQTNQPVMVQAQTVLGSSGERQLGAQTHQIRPHQSRTQKAGCGATKVCCCVLSFNLHAPCSNMTLHVLHSYTHGACELFYQSDFFLLCYLCRPACATLCVSSS